ncbi:MAG: hypothetical protein IKI93_06235, partial [Clostridia bacterium]|nr:hypothetical protein [Clostridia bacterium]
MHFADRSIILPVAMSTAAFISAVLTHSGNCIKFMLNIFIDVAGYTSTEQFISAIHAGSDIVKPVFDMTMIFFIIQLISGIGVIIVPMLVLVGAVVYISTVKACSITIVIGHIIMLIVPIGNCYDGIYKIFSAIITMPVLMFIISTIVAVDIYRFIVPFIGNTYQCIVSMAAGYAANRANTGFIIAVAAGRVAYNAPTVLPIVTASHTTGTAYTFIPANVIAGTAAIRATTGFIKAMGGADIVTDITPAVLPVVTARCTTVAAYAFIPVSMAAGFAANRAN